MTSVCLMSLLDKSETRISASVLKQYPNTFFLLFLNSFFAPRNCIQTHDITFLFFVVVHRFSSSVLSLFVCVFVQAIPHIHIYIYIYKHEI